MAGVGATTSLEGHGWVVDSVYRCFRLFALSGSHSLWWSSMKRTQTSDFAQWLWEGRRCCVVFGCRYSRGIPAWQRFPTWRTKGSTAGIRPSTFSIFQKKAWGSWGWVSVASVPSWSVTWSIEILHLGSARHISSIWPVKKYAKQIQLMLGCTCECSHQNAYILGLTKHDLTFSRKFASSSWSPCCFSKVLAGAGIANHSYMVAISIISIIIIIIIIIH